MATALIVGGGLSGLAAGHHLRKAGWKVTVLDAGDTAGGRARTIERDGFVIDAGPDALSGAYTEYQALMTELGLADRIVTSSPVLGLVRGGRIIDIDGSRPLAAAMTPALSLGAKLRLARGIWTMRREIAAADAFALVDSAAEDDPQASAFDVARAAFGEEAATWLIDPLVRLVTGSGSRRATGLAVRSVLSAWSAPMINVTGGLSLLPAKLADGLDLRLGVTVDRVEQDGSGAVLARWTNASGGACEERFDAAVIACQVDAAVRVAPAIAAAIGDLEPAIAPLSLMTISLAFDRPTRSKAYAVPIPSAEREDELLMFLQHNKAPDRAPAGKSLVTYYIDHAATARWFAMDDAMVTARAIAFVTGLMPELAGSFRFSHITRWPRAGSHSYPGYYRAVAKALDRLNPHAAIQLAGDFHSAGSMETALRTGRQAAERLIAREIRANAPAEYQREAQLT